MQRTVVIAASFILLVQSVSALPVAFHSPGNLEATDFRATGGQWLLVVFQPSDDAGFLDAPVGAHHANVTSVHAARVKEPNQGVADINVHNETSESDLGPDVISFSPARMGLASVYVEAERLEVGAQGIVGELNTKDASSNTEDFSRPEDRDSRVRGHLPGGEHAVVAIQPASSPANPFSLRANSVRYVEWYNLGSACEQTRQGCPSNGGPSIQQMELPSRHTVSTERHSHETLAGTLGALELRGEMVYLAFGGERLDASIQGFLRLPLATVGQTCPDCMSPDNQTLSLSGNVTLSGLQMGVGGSLQGNVSGDLDSARFDEAPIDPSALVGLGVTVGVGVAVGGGLLLVKSLLLPFVTRLREADALRHPRRRAIFDYIHANPGANVSEVVEGTGLASGTLRHHLSVLKRAGQVVERPHGGTLRLFENHGRFDADWNTVVLLREPVLAKVHAWIAANPRSPQSAIVQALAQTEGWNRSTTQHRLKRLVAGGLVEIRQQGRLKLHSVVERPPGMPKAKAAAPGILA